MEIKIAKEGTKLTIAVTGRIVTPTAPELEQTLQASLPGITELVFDFSALEYISSAGLRVLGHAQAVMDKQGSMVIQKPNDEVMDVFEITGMTDILTIEQ